MLWPVDGSDERLTVELSGLPVFDRERTFRGYRGFGVCRDVARLNAIAQRSPARRRRRRPPMRRRPPLHRRTSGRGRAGPDPGRALRVLTNSRAGSRAASTKPTRMRSAPPTPTQPAARGRRASTHPHETEPPIADNHAAVPRPAADRRAGLSAEPSALCEQGVPGLGRQRQPRCAGGGGRTRQPDDRVRRHRHRGGRPPARFRSRACSDETSVVEARLLQVPWDGESAFALADHAAARRHRDARRRSTRCARSWTSSARSSTPPPTA